MSRRFAWVVTIVYMLSAGVWIVVSDTVLAAMGLPAERIASVSLLKGLGFVLVTGTVLFFATSHAGRRYTDLSGRLSAIIDMSPVPIITLDLDGNVTLWNPAAERVFGWTEAEVLGRPNPIVPEQERTESRRIQAPVASDEGAPGLELTRVTKDGRTLLVRLFSASLHDERGTLTGLMGIHEDITRRREARQELERHRDHLEELVDERTLELRMANDALIDATEAKDTFLASMSHELRTPLNSIIGFSGIMLQGLAGPLNDEQSKQLAMVNSAGHHLLALVNDVLDLVKIEAGQTSLSLQTVRVADVLDSVEGTIRPLADDKHLALRCELTGDLASIVTDRRRLEQILLNLLSNAIKFTDDGSVSLTVSTDDDVVRFEVTDTGIGIPHESLDRIFDEFVQIDRSDLLRPEGTGLGLPISRRLAALLGGRIVARSEVGIGSSFVLELPQRAAGPLAEQPQPDTDTCTVLVVDDDAHARGIVSRILAAKGYRAIEAADGEQGLAAVAKYHPDCVLLDLVMPRLDGWAVLERLRDDPATADIPVICTSIIDEGEQGVAKGFAGYLVKPINPSGLVALLEETLAGVACIPKPEAEETT